MGINRSAAETPRDLTVIHVRGGLKEDASGDIARAGHVKFYRADDETPQQFRSRAEKEARAAKEPVLVFGGLTK